MAKASGQAGSTRRTYGTGTVSIDDRPGREPVYRVRVSVPGGRRLNGQARTKAEAAKVLKQLNAQAAQLRVIRTVEHVSSNPSALASIAQSLASIAASFETLVARTAG